MNKNPIPIKEIIAPVISLGVIFSLKIKIAAGIINIGVIDVIVDTIPVGACCTARSESDTPRNGPKKAPKEIRFIALISFSAK